MIRLVSGGSPSTTRVIGENGEDIKLPIVGIEARVSTRGAEMWVQIECPFEIHLEPEQVSFTISHPNPPKPKSGLKFFGNDS